MEPKVSSTSISTSSLIRTPPSAAPSSSHYGEATPQPRCRTGQGSDRQQTRRVCEPTRAVRAAGRGRLTLAPPKARRAAAGRATSGTESRPVRHPRKPPTPQISRFCVRTLATTAAICRGQNESSLWLVSRGCAGFLWSRLWRWRCACRGARPYLDVRSGSGLSEEQVFGM